MMGDRLLTFGVYAFVVGVGLTFGERAAKNVLRRYEEAGLA